MAFGFAKCCSEVFGSGNDGVIGGSSGHFNGVWEPVDSVDDACGIGGRSPNVETLVVVQAWAYIVSLHSVKCKGFASVCRFMRKDFDARWHQRCFDIIAISVNLRMCRQFWVDARET